MDAFELNQKLVGNIRAFLRDLLPNGEEHGGKFYVGSVRGEKGKSLCVEMTGEKAGYWCDHAEPEMRSNSLIGLWSEVRCGGNFKEAIKQIKKEYGIVDNSERYVSKIKKSFKQPSRDGITKAEKSSKVIQYLKEERGIMEDTIAKLQICASKDDTYYSFIYFNDEGEPCMRKNVKLERTEKGKKQSWVEKDGLATLFGKPAVPDSANYIIITEGELDCATWVQQGFHAVSIPMGVENHQWIEYDWEWLNRFERIYINFDSDNAGQKAAKAVVERLGRERCYLVSLPYKDANEALLAGEDTFVDFLNNASMLKPDEIGFFFDNYDAIGAALSEDESALGTPTPWDLPFRIRRGETTVVTAYNGHGKSQLLYHLAVHLQFNGWRGMIASMEVAPVDTKLYLAQIAICHECRSLDDIESIRGTPLEDMIFYTKLGHVKWRELLDAYRFCIRKYRADFLIVDSFMLCGVKKDNYDEHNEFMAAMQILARETNTHIFVVAHARKGQDERSEYRIPGKHAVKGSGDLTDLCANLLIVWRNIEKDDAVAKAAASNNPQQVISANNIHDGILRLAKQKNGKGSERGKLGQTKLWFNSMTGQFHSKPYDVNWYLKDYRQINS